MSLGDDYVEQLTKGLEELDKILFPPEKRLAFADAAQIDIEAGKNTCLHCPDKKTMQRIWPYGAWICDECANAMWKTGGWPNGVMVFDMSDRPEGWKPE